MLKKQILFFVVLMLSVGLWANDNVPYIDATGALQHQDGVTEITSTSTTLAAGWYVVIGTDIQTGTLVCSGAVNLILADGAKLTAKGDDTKGTPGIKVFGEGNSLTIYGQTAQTGQLNANGGSNAAGIGGEKGGSGSNITINGGVVVANGGQQGAGIGGGQYDKSVGQPVFGSDITINGGAVTATGGTMAAGIGGGWSGSGSNITINGGTVTVTGEDYAAGIGGGMAGFGSDITINGGEVIAEGGNMAAGIGGGMASPGSNIAINGGTVTATGGMSVAGIGGGLSASGYDIYISDAYVLKAGATANPTNVIAHSSATDMGSALTQQYVKIEGLATPYTRTATNGQWGTVCLPYAASSFSGADFYKVNYFDSEDKLYLEPVTALEAGVPYLFEATATAVTINHNASAPEIDEVGDFRGLHGSLVRKILTSDATYSYAAIANNQVNIVTIDNTVIVPACRAYLDMNEVPEEEQPHNAPLRCIGVPREQPTALETIDNAQCTMHNGKYLINGLFVIVKDNKMYNVQGLELK